MSERDPDKESGEGTTPFRDSGIHGEEELHTSFDDLEAPAPDSDPFAGQGGADRAGDDDGDDEGSGDDENDGDGEGRARDGAAEVGDGSAGDDDRS